MLRNEQRRPGRGGAAVFAANGHRVHSTLVTSRHLARALDELIAAYADAEAGRTISSRLRIAAVVADLAAVRASLRGVL